MAGFIKKYKVVIIAVLADLFLFWLLYSSGLVLPYINPSIEQYKASGTSFPRNYNQVLLWFVLHAPTSIIAAVVSGKLHISDAFLSVSVVQTGVLTYYLEKHFRKKWNAKAL